MSQTIAFTSTELAILASYLASGTGSLALNPQAQNITEASRSINLKFNIGNKNTITHDLPPQLTPPQQIRQIIIGSTTLSSSAAWTPAWASAVALLRAQGRSIQSGPQPVNKAQHVTTSQGQLLVQALAATGVSTATVDLAVAAASTVTQVVVGPQGPAGATGPQGVVGPQGPAGQNALDVSSFEVDASGNLIVMFGDSSTINLGSVLGPQGLIGATGPQGVVGPQGPTGPSGPGSGDVISQGGSYVDNSVVRYDGTSGTLIQVSAATISDAGLLTATSFSGDGSLITALNATQLITGTVPVARLGASGTASASTYLRGDNAWEAVIPTGVITMWYGSIASIPSGWYLCDGTNGTPNLRDRFVVGAGTTYAVAATGGSKDAIVVSHSHTATVTDPGHSHREEYFDANGGGYGLIAGPNQYNATKQTDIKFTGISVANSTEGSSATNANLPPYYALAYIMKS